MLLGTLEFGRLTTFARLFVAGRLQQQIPFGYYRHWQLSHTLHGSLIPQSLHTIGTR
jgi:hypothetical protein